MFNFLNIFVDGAISFFDKREKNRSSLLRMMPKNSICAEIGVWKGCLSKEILKTVKPKKLHLIDPWEYMPQYKHRLYSGSVAKSQKDMDQIHDQVQRKLNKYNKNITYHRTTADKAVKEIKDSYFDWIYIDGNHSYEYVIKDLANYFPKVKKGGYITGDDYFSYFEIFNGFGVRRAVNEFINNYPVETVLLKSQFVLKKK